MAMAQSLSAASYALRRRCAAARSACKLAQRGACCGASTRESAVVYSVAAVSNSRRSAACFAASMCRSSFRTFLIDCPASTSSGSKRSASLKCFCAWSRSAESISASPRSLYASGTLGCRLITCRVVRRGASQMPSPSSARTRASFVAEAEVLRSIDAKNVRASEKSCRSIAAVPSLCHSCSSHIASSSCCTSSPPPLLTATLSWSTALSKAPISQYAFARRLCALIMPGSRSSAREQSAMHSSYWPSVMCTAARLQRNLGTVGACSMALVYSLSASSYTRCSNLELAA
mmetsp:Transcript_18999/g.47420  ORF Transcript_18999/g.47420 Transcript_18999/m.47420 type:complete len:289 (+) Transcript_18999:442-1308(+)